MPFELSIPCTDCEERTASLVLKHFKVLGCEPDPARAGRCLLRYEDPILGTAAAAPAVAAPPPANGMPPVGAASASASINMPAAAAAMPLLFAGKAQPLSAEAMQQTCAGLGVEPEAMWSVVKVETSGCGFLKDRRPKILFERHIFSRRTKRKFDADAPGISNPQPGGYAGGAGEYYRLMLAMELDQQAALESASWGLGQIMGFNAKAAGFDGVEQLIAATCDSEDHQLAAIQAFLVDNNLAQALRSRDWARLARGYNGPAYKTYDKQLAQWHAHFKAHGVPDVRIRQAQVGLMMLGYASEGSVDGIYGRYTRDALMSFQREERLEVDGRLSPATMIRIRARVGWD